MLMHALVLQPCCDFVFLLSLFLCFSLFSFMLCLACLVL
jgi:hypothetical protein